MFWGLILKANKKYTQTTKQAFHISHAALDVTSCADGPIQLFLTYENIKYLICTLRKNTTEQVMLDLNFNEGDEISLQSQGSGTIHISGYVTELNDPFDDLDEEEESETEEQQVTATKKSKKSNDLKANNAAKAAVGKKAEATAADDDDDDDDEDDSDFNGELAGEEDASDDDEEGEEEDDEDDDEDDDDEDDDDDESEDEEVQQPKAKQPKLEKPKQNGVEQQKKEGKQKKDKKEAAPQQQAAQKQKGGEQTIAGGVKVEDIRVGNGPEAKSGKRAQVYYEGRLKSNNKVFDSLKQGAPFKFGLGRGEVIKGWDVGVVGMKVGGKRRITCPPHMAYGARGAPPSIPPNSTLVFEVELKGVQ